MNSFVIVQNLVLMNMERKMRLCTYEVSTVVLKQPSEIDHTNYFEVLRTGTTQRDKIQAVGAYV